ncbi:MAG: ribose-5-phosphate isomerase RpiA [Gemmatimonadales bacterium]
MTAEADGLKRRAAEKAFEQVRSGMVLGLGTGSTVAHLLDLVGGALRSGTLRDLVCVPTSTHTEERAQSLGIPLIELADRERVDLTIDGADEISPELDLIKGGGGALLREKMVAQASARVVIIADATKRVPRLGTTFALPVEVVRWGWESHARFLRGLGADVTLRAHAGVPTTTDNGHLLLDCRFPGGIADPVTLEEALAHRAGVVETGLFLGLASEAVVASPTGVDVLRRKG